MKFLVTADLHFTDQKQDEYRLGLLPWLKATAKKNEVNYIAILGDLTDKKDRHPARLVNRIADDLADMNNTVKWTFLLRGNHDYVDADTPFFRFLNEVRGVTVVTKPIVAECHAEGDVLFLPHVRDVADWGKITTPEKHGLIFAHQTFTGAKASNGEELEGMPSSIFDNCEPGTVFSGDIHGPQRVGKVEYVGSPYHVHYGDSFTPRVLLIDGTKRVDLRFPAPRKPVAIIRRAEDLKGMGLDQGDMVKVRLKLSREDTLDWKKHKRAVVEMCDKLGVELHGPELVPLSEKKPLREEGKTRKITKSAEELFKLYLKRRKPPKATEDIGWEILDAAK